MPARPNDAEFSIRPADYPDSVIDTKAMTSITNTLRKAMMLTNRSDRGVVFKGKHGFIIARCNRIENAKFIRSTIASIDWEAKGVPALVNVSANDYNVMPHIEVRTMDNLATFEEVKDAISRENFGTDRVNCDRWRLIHQMNQATGGIVMMILTDRSSTQILMRNKYATIIQLGAFAANTRVVVPRSVREMMGETFGKWQINRINNVNRCRFIYTCKVRSNAEGNASGNGRRRRGRNQEIRRSLAGRKQLRVTA